MNRLPKPRLYLRLFARRWRYFNRRALGQSCVLHVLCLLPLLITVPKLAVSPAPPKSITVDIVAEAPKPLKPVEVTPQPPQPQPPRPMQVHPTAQPIEATSADTSADPDVASQQNMQGMTYEQRLQRHVERRKRYPAAVRAQNLAGRVLLRFRIDRRGRLLYSSIERSSGHAVLDQLALAILKESAPLPAIPAEYSRAAALDFTIPLEFDRL